MARGMIYEIENNPIDLGYMDIEDFYEKYPDCDGMQTVDGNDALQRVSDFVATLEKYGASVEGFNIPDEEAHAHPDRTYYTDDNTADDNTVTYYDTPIPYYRVYCPADFRQKYFAERYNKAKDMMANMTLDEFATNACFQLYNLRITIHGHHDDIAYYNRFSYELDTFIRDNCSDFEFYISAYTCIYMR